MKNYRRGMDSNLSKLTDIDVIDIRSAYRQAINLRKHISENLTAEALAKRYGVSRSHIEKICGGQIWTHLP